MPVVFSGHGSPMVALEHNQITEGMQKVGEKIISTYGKPKAILAISAHWYTDGTYIQSAGTPKQIYDMYGFPPELYEVKYPVRGDNDLTNEVLKLLGNNVTINDSWGIDHGTWTVLVHMFPKADIPVVQLSVNGNLMRVEWDNEGGTPMTYRFNGAITNAVISHDHKTAIDYEKLPDAGYAVPTPDHYLPLLYCLGAARQDQVEVFNNVCNLGSMAMTGFVFHPEEN